MIAMLIKGFAWGLGALFALSVAVACVSLAVLAASSVLSWTKDEDDK